MAFLTYNTSDTTCAGLLTRRVLIGRRLSHGVVLADPSVSRLHAYLDPNGNHGWVVTDAGSKTGTFVNGNQVYRQELRDGDEIRVGTVQIHYRAADQLPDDANVVALSPPDGNVKTSGILFDCPTCGAPLWVANDLAGKRGLCRHCKKPVTVPDPYPAFEPKSAVAEPPPKPAKRAVPSTETTPKKRLPRCAVCHADIQPGETLTTCPECAMNFHSECWQENYGCSSYGCRQVDILNPKAKPAAAPEDTDIETAAAEADAADGTTDSMAEPVSSTPWATIALAASVVATVLGAVAFGIPAALVALWSLVLMLTGGKKKALLLVALLISLVGVAAGLIVSDIWYFNARHLPFKI